MPQATKLGIPRAILLGAASAVGSFSMRAHATTIWSAGPTDLNFSLATGADVTLPQNQDRITPTVWVTRNSFHGIFNAYSETFFGSSSPADTEWAFSGLGGNPTFAYGAGAALFPTLSFTPWGTSLGSTGGLQFNITSHPGVVHLITNDTYIDINFTAWGSHGDSSFAYTRATGLISALWNGSAGNWSNSTNWSTNPAFPNNSANFHFAAAINAGSALLDVMATVSSLTLAGSANAWTSNLDLASNSLIVQPDPAAKATAFATLNNQIAFGQSHFAGGGAAGASGAAAGITDSTLPANFGIALLDNALTHFTTFRGQPADANSLLLSPELLGDANADGHVDLTDLSTVLNNFGTATPNWTDGNFDNAPTIDLTDLSAVLNNFGQSNPNANTAGLATATPAPEPASLTILLLAGQILQRRRK
ncbi:MAG TPA: hypothetical protein VM008_02900 [Phycisphaerae bacterium]|nr:hypothetical protein [Phycisphaerae bacterium]